MDTRLEDEGTIEALCIQFLFQSAVRIGEGVALKFSDVEYGKIAIQRMEEKVVVFDGEKLKRVRKSSAHNCRKKKPLKIKGLR